MASYEKPEVTDYGTLVDLTAAGHVKNADTIAGVANTAFSVGP